MSIKIRRIALAAIMLLCATGLLAQPSRTAVTFRLAPPETRLFERDRAIGTASGGNGERTAVFHPGVHALTARAEGYVDKIVAFRADGVPITIEAKLERIDSRPTLLALVPTGPRPKSVEYTPDGRFIVATPLSGQSVDVFDARTFSRAATLSVPARYAIREGFVESAFVTGADGDELWVSQMQANAVHIFSLSDFSYRATVSTGGGFPKVVCPHPDGRRVFVSNWLSGTVSVINARTRTVVGFIRTGGIPRGLAVSPDGRSLFVANFDLGVLDVVNLATNAVDRRLLGGGAKRHVVADAARARLYISDMARGSVFVLNLADYRTLAEIAVGSNPNTIKLSPDGRALYVSVRGRNNATSYEFKGPEFGKIVVIDCDTLAVTDWLWGGNQPTGLALSPDGQRLVFSDFLDDRLEVYALHARP